VAIEIQGQWCAPIHSHAQFIIMLGAPRILLQMNSDFRARSAWCVVAAPVAGLVVDPILSSFRFAAILALHASAALLVALRLLRVQFLAGDPDKS
jgi:hypothetical protein